MMWKMCRFLLQDMTWTMVKSIFTEVLYFLLSLRETTLHTLPQQIFSSLFALCVFCLLRRHFNPKTAVTETSFVISVTLSISSRSVSLLASTKASVTAGPLLPFYFTTNHSFCDAMLPHDQSLGHG